MRRISVEEKMRLPFAEQIVNALKSSNASLDQIEIEELMGIDADDEESQNVISETLSTLLEVPNVVTVDMNTVAMKYLIQK